MTAAHTHCPNCFEEHRAGYTICTVCGTLLVPGPSPAFEPTELAPSVGRIEVVRTGEPRAEPDRFALEEAPVVLTTIVEEDVDAFLATLEDQEIGARRGDATDDGGVEIRVHAANLTDAQAALVEFTGDVTLVDDIAVEWPDAADDAWAVVTWVRLGDAGAQANRLRRGGLDVRLELPDDGDRDAMSAQAAILVASEDLESARALLGIAY